MMDHRKAIDLLARFAAGEIRGETREELARHIEECEECRGWTATYELFSEALAGDWQAGGLGHPSSEQLARHAVAGQPLTGPEREAVERHLASCASCARELSLTREALSGSADASRADRPPIRRLAASPPMRLALAASLILAVALAFSLRRTPTADEPLDLDLVGQSLEGTRLIEATGSITASEVTVASEGDVTFRAGEVVILSDGFSVGPGGSFTAETFGHATEPRAESNQPSRGAGQPAAGVG